MAVRPLPRQSTMLLLQEHMGGQEPDARLQGCTKALPPWPEDKHRHGLQRHVAARRRLFLSSRT